MVPSNKCGPFISEHAFVKNSTWRGGQRLLDGVSNRCVYEKLTLIWNRVRPQYGYPPERTGHSTPPDVFHFSHGDLSEVNILLDPETRSVTAVLDWELAGFYPAWMACVTRTSAKSENLHIPPHPFIHLCTSALATSPHLALCRCPGVYDMLSQPL
jgi:hypothetical protein